MKSFDIADLKTKQFPTWAAANEVEQSADDGRWMLMERFLDDLEGHWNVEHREELKKTNCQKLFTAATVRQYAGITEAPADDAPQAIKDRASFAGFLEAQGDE